MTRRVASGRPTLVARVADAGAGVDPLSLVISYRRILVGAALYDPASGVAIFPLPARARTIPAGRTRALVSASDFQEAKNVNSVGSDLMPNTAFKRVSIMGVRGPALTWVAPPANECVAGKTTGLLVVASSTRPVRSVRFLVDGKQVAVDHKGVADVFSATWRTGAAAKGKHVLQAVVTDASGRTLAANRSARVCR